MKALVKHVKPLQKHTTGIVTLKPNQFAFSTSAFWWPNLASQRQSWTQVNVYKPSPIQQYQNYCHIQMPSWRDGFHILYHSNAWRTKNKPFRPVGEGRQSSGPTILRMMREEVRNILPPPKLFHIQHSFAARDAGNLEENAPQTLKSLNSESRPANPPNIKD